MSLWLDTANAVLALRIRDDEAAVQHDQADTGYANLAGSAGVVLHSVTVAVHEHLAGNATFIAEYAALHIYLEQGCIGSYRCTTSTREHGSCPIYTVALLRTDAKPHEIAQLVSRIAWNYAHVEGQGPANSACWVGERNRIQTRGSRDITEAGWQQVFKGNSGNRLAGGIAHTDGVAHGISNFRNGLVTGFADQNGAARQRVKRNVVMQHVGNTRTKVEFEEILRTHGTD